MSYSIGLDFGTNSVRAIVADCRDGRAVGTAVYNYPSGEQGVIVSARDPHLARQHPQDYHAGLEASVRGAIAAALAEPGFAADKVIGIGVTATGSSPLPVDAQNQPLSLQAQFIANPAAQCWLWKDHTSMEEAGRITATAAQHRPHFIAKCGGIYSSEWFWAKIWHCLNVAPEVFHAAHSWVELGDYIPAVLAGITDPALIQRGVCMAGHKALYCEEWGGLPDREFLSLLHPALGELRARLYTTAYEVDRPAGTLGAAMAEKLGLPVGIPVAMGAMDVHYGAIGSGVKPGVLVKAIGTSTCDCAVAAPGAQLADIPGVCGMVKGSILPGLVAIEAGQSAVGDIFNWWVNQFGGTHEALNAEAAQLSPGQSGLLALDWNNGNRTVLVDQALTGLLLGQTLRTRPAEVYRALIEGTAFGARMIIERMKEYGVPIEAIVCCGGIAEKSPLLMQIYADVTGCALQVSRSDQSCALGAALAAAVLAGPEKSSHADIASAQAAMTGVKPITYQPKPEAAAVYERLFALYRQLHDASGGVNRSPDLARVMKDLLAIQREASAH